MSSSLPSSETATGHPESPLLTPWLAGPHHPGDGPVVVSVTEYSAAQRRTLPGMAVNGLRMRMGWYAMPGAVGLWLWALPATKRGGSISVWAGEADLERFVSLPHHVDIMRRYRSRGSVRSTTWHADTFEPQAVVARARAWINAAP